MIRSSASRIREALERLNSDPNVWIATASSGGVPHVVPLSLSWIDEQIIVATPSDTPTARNAAKSGRARAALDSASEVVLIDADVRCVDLSDSDESMLSAYIRRVGWDPRSEPNAWCLLILTPRRVQAWNSVSEINGRTIMSNGAWRGD